jgi:hypothetical protein
MYRGSWQSTSSGGWPRPLDGPADRAGSGGTLYGSGLPGGRPAPAQRRRGAIVAGTVLVLFLAAGGVGAYEWYGSGSPGQRDVAGTASRPATAGTSPMANASGAAQAGTGARPESADPGVAMCKLLRDTKPSPGTGSGSGTGTTTMNYAKARYIRGQFASSRYADLRRAGTQFVDVITVQPSAPTGTDIAAIMRQLLGRYITAFTDLSKACANHGVRLPPITVHTYQPSLPPT